MDKGATPDEGATPDKGATPEGASLFRQRAHTMADTYKKKSSAKKRLREAFKSKKCGKFPKGGVGVTDLEAKFPTSRLGIF